MRNMILALITICICGCSSGGSGGTTIPIAPDEPTTPDVSVITLMDAWAVVTDRGDQFTVDVSFYNPGDAATMTLQWSDSLYVGDHNEGSWVMTAEPGWNEMSIPMLTDTGVVSRVWAVETISVDVSIRDDVVHVWPVAAVALALSGGDA